MKTSINRPPTPDAEEDQDHQPTLQEIINIKGCYPILLPNHPSYTKQSATETQKTHGKMIESGEKERLKELLRERLIECGWKDEMKALCRAFARKKGRNNVTVDDLVQVITPKGRASVPDSVKAELLQRIRTFLTSVSI